MQGCLTTHVLDIAQGRPAVNMLLELWQLGLQSGNRTLLKTTCTNADGRTDIPLLADGELTVGCYELVFSVDDYFTRQAIATTTPAFLDRVPIRFGIADPSMHYHIPLLISPWTYSTYRGS
jgi:5-hydroxyisourate hydrolase